MTQGFWTVWAGLLVLVPGTSMVAAAETESRDFSVLVDGKPAGAYHVTVQKRPDGSAVMSGRADVQVKRLGFTVYSYHYQGSEIWKDGKLLRLESQCNDDGKKFTVRAAAANNGLRVKVNGQERTAAADVWTTTYWSVPNARCHNKKVPLLDSDTGRDIHATLEYLGGTSIKVLGQMKNCRHYRLSGDVKVEVWYDERGRLVREQSVDDGHVTVLELTALHN